MLSVKANKSGVKLTTSKFKFTDMFSTSAFQLQFNRNNLKITIDYGLLIVLLLLFFIYLLLIILCVVVSSWIGVIALLMPLLTVIVVAVYAVITKSLNVQ